MVIVYSILSPIISAILGILWVYKWILIISIFLSWIRPDPYNPIVRLIYSLTEPVLSKVREWLPFLRIGMIDLSPIAVFIFIQILENFIINFTIHFRG